LVISHTIAVGIFLTPAALIGAIAAPALTLTLWFVCGGLVLAGAFTFGELASRYPSAGGLYVYLREAWGPRVAFLYGWQSLLVMDPGVTAALAAGASQYVVLLWPALADSSRSVAVVLVWSLALCNMAGLTFGARVFGLMTVLKLCTLLGIVVLAVSTGRGDWAHFATPVPRPALAPPIGEALAVGLISVFFSFGGFWETSRMAAEVRDPRRTLPLALVLGVLAVTAMYVLTTVAFIYLVPPASMVSATETARHVGVALIGPAGPQILAAIVLLSVVASAMAMLMVSPRLYEAMARDGLFPGVVSRRHPRTGAPVRATAVLASLATVYVLLGTFDQIVAFFICTALVFIALSAAALFVVRRRATPGGLYRAPGYPVTPALFVGLVGVIVLMVLVNRPWQALSGFGLAAAGLVAYQFLGSAAARPAAAPGEDGR
jgi:APA family basic amino acid/polyamine antiporter